MADTPHDFAEALVAGIRRPQDLQDTAEHGREAVLARYDWDPLADKLDAVWRTVAGVPGRGTPRRTHP